MLTPSRMPRRAGASLLELMIGLTLFGLVMTGVTKAIAEQSRFQTGAARVVGAQRSLRYIGDLLPNEIRALGTGAGDIYAMSGTSLDLRVTTGSSVVCAVGAGATSVTIPPVQLATGVPLTAWRDVPVSGDSVFVFDEGASSARTDDQWRAYRLTAAPSAGSCPLASGFARTAAEAAAGMTLTFASALTATTQVGAPIRFFRPARYALAAGADGRWYLGYSECAGSCSPVEIVAGPVRAPSGQGLSFTFRDSLGAITATPSLVASVEVALRTEGPSTAERSRLRSGAFGDSLRVSVSVRNPR